ncbi:MAG: hypothetical protein HQ541_14875, partial [Mariniphaga sp.]|nr:hypothetical protein [Mariniphaga sp.]
MKKLPLADQPHDLIKAHILDPDNSPLSEIHQKQLDRIVSVSKIIDKNPVHKHVVLLHQSKFPDLSRTVAYEDIRLAKKLYPTIHEFEYDFWKIWLINDIASSIAECRESKAPNKFRQLALL